MNLTRIEIAGFKSFENRLGMNFTGGITAILGPNGCGKTNIVDAIRWVLGEQKTRLLRNTKMENVIFNGTKKRKALGMAEVHMTLSNEDRALPLDYSEVTISRKLFRDGGSEYSINGETARLKDIRSLLVDTGLGNHTYSIIEREMVDSVISEKDQDKRFLLEEAAGVMRYRLQREEALRKISHTENDLTRLNDILAELDKEIRSLRYQMGKAKRYTRLREKLEVLEAALVKRSLYDLLGEVDEIKKEKTHHEGITLADDNDITVREDRLQKLRIEAAELERRLQDFYENRHQLSQSLQQHEERIAILTERMASNENRIREDDEEVQRSRKKLESLAEELAGLREVVEAKEEILENRRGELMKAEGSFRDVAGRLNVVRGEIRDRKQLELDLLREQERVRGMHEHLTERLKEVREKKEREGGDVERLTSKRAELEARLEEGRAEAEEKRVRIGALNDRLEELAEKTERVIERIAECDDATSHQKIELNRFKEKTDLLKRIKSEHTQREDEFVSETGRVKGILADRVRVERKFRKCFEACLSPVLQSLLTESKADALQCVEEIRGNGNGNGKGKVQILYPNGNGGRSNEPDDGSSLGHALDFLEGDDGVMDYLGSYLSDVYVAENVSSAMSMLERNPKRRVATLDGIFFDGPGRIMVAGSDDIEMTVLEFDSKIEELVSSIESCETQIEVLRQKRVELGESKTGCGNEIAALRLELRGVEEENEKVVDSRGELEKQLAVVDEKLANLAAGQAEYQRVIDDLSEKLAVAPEPSSEMEDDEAIGRELTALERRALDLERDKEALGERTAMIKLDIATITGEITTAVEKRKNAEMLDSELKELITYREEDAARCREEIESAQTEVGEAREKIGHLHTDVDKIEKDIDRAKESHAEVSENCDRFEKELKGLKDERDHKRENIQRCNLDIATRETRIHDLVEKARENFNQDLAPFARDRGRFDPAEWEELDFDTLEDLRRQVEAFGPVNMLAVDEFNERKERFDFLSSQKADLEEAKDALNQAIRRINREARRRISETFEKVRENFKTTFLTLFDGGEADLLFVDSDDPLEANIKIVANPKGKRLHDISSLSGGERALVALSLLFAIYLVKPSPFCVFDEVDAPLDDANIGRFVRLLKSFTDHTRFIVITHNKKTMEAADTLYGVTMEEPGVSKMISVHIGDVDRFQENRQLQRDDAVRESADEEVPVQT